MNLQSMLAGEPLASVRVLPRWILAVLFGIALLAVAIPAWIVATSPRIVHQPPKVVISTRVVPKTELPPVEPVVLQAVNPDDARSINAAIPFSTEPNPAARGFIVTGSADSQLRAVDCLAAAVYYEAGDDAVGQRAVAQVILNRMRHPAFPKTVCGVVFQGQERRTGCQFTFTCDGAMVRYGPSAAAWTRARDVARMALYGSVYAPVGHATHYHTDWVVPYWSASLEKITEVHTHLFFRWTGWWGTPSAFTRAYAGVEPNIGKMARLSGSHVGDPAADLAALGLDPALAPPLNPEDIAEKDVPAAIAGGDGNSFILALPRGMGPDSFPSLAIRTCGERPYCKFMAWSDPGKAPAKLPLNSGHVATMSFSYLRDQNLGFAKALWNCDQYRRPTPVQCMRAQPLARQPVPVPATGQPPAAAGAIQPPPITPLTGIRRKTETPPPATGQRQTLTLPVMPAPKASPAPKQATPPPSN
jgi:spore germination cell wall hydrolase CwlJ-like protein